MPTISISSDAILAQVYARTALHYFASGQTKSPATRHSADAIAAMVHAICGPLMLTLLPVLHDTNVYDTESLPPLIKIDLKEDVTVDPIRLRLLAEQHIVDMLLAEMLSTVDTTASARYTNSATRALKSIRSLIATALPLY